MARTDSNRAGVTGAAPSRQAPPLTPNQEHVLVRLKEAGGCMHYTLLTRWAASALPAWGSGILKSLERRGLVRIHRRWGAWEYGQPGLIELTAAGHNTAHLLHEPG